MKRGSEERKDKERRGERGDEESGGGENKHTNQWLEGRSGWENKSMMRLLATVGPARISSVTLTSRLK